MNAKELRIGNLTYYTNPHSDRIVQEVLTPKDLDYAFSLDPIPLTEEWLIELGFQHKGFPGKYFIKKNEFAVSTVDGKFRFIQGNFVCQLVLTELQYVHQLQNLYFALTGEELTQELT